MGRNSFPFRGGSLGFQLRYPGSESPGFCLSFIRPLCCFVRPLRCFVRPLRCFVCPFLLRYRILSLFFPTFFPTFFSCI